jgi:hypothetical protein
LTCLDDDDIVNTSFLLGLCFVRCDGEVSEWDWFDDDDDGIACAVVVDGLSSEMEMSL